MRKIFTFSAALAMAALAWAGGPVTTPAQKKALPKKATPTAVARMPVTPTTANPMVAKKPATGPATSSAKRGIKKIQAPVVRTTWRNRQTSPTADRYREIQDALVSKGYLSTEEANGAWGVASAEALKKFQAEQALETTGKIDSLSLIALGLGPKHDYSSVPRVVDGNLQPEFGRN